MLSHLWRQLKTEWAQFKTDKPGKRFMGRYARRQHEKFSERIVHSLLGFILFLVGLVMIPLPGPGSLPSIFGLALIGCEFKPIAGFFDRVELWLRPYALKAKDVWTHFSPPAKTAVTIATVFIGTALSLGMYHMMK